MAQGDRAQEEEAEAEQEGKQEANSDYNNLSADAKKLLAAIESKLAHTAVVKKLKNILSQRSELRTEEELQILADNTKLTSFENLTPQQHRDVCRVMSLRRIKKDELLQHGVFISAFHFVLTGSVQLQEATTYDVTSTLAPEKPTDLNDSRSRRESSTVRLSKGEVAQLLEMEMEQVRRLASKRGFKKNTSKAELTRSKNGIEACAGRASPSSRSL
jgi:hypothetical protein